MSDHGHVRPASGDRVVLGREVVEVEHVGVVGASGQERRLPRRRQVVGECRVDRGEHYVGGVLRSLKEGCIGTGAATALAPASNASTAAM
jgi:hypothetical protein